MAALPHNSGDFSREELENQKIKAEKFLNYWQTLCLEKGFQYVRESDDHYVTATEEQMADMLRDLLGVDVRRPNGCGWHERKNDAELKRLRSEVAALRSQWADAEVEAARSVKENQLAENGYYDDPPVRLVGPPDGAEPVSYASYALGWNHCRSHYLRHLEAVSK